MRGPPRLAAEHALQQCEARVDEEGRKRQQQHGKPSGRRCESRGHDQAGQHEAQRSATDISKEYAGFGKIEGQEAQATRQHGQGQPVPAVRQQG